MPHSFPPYFPFLDNYGLAAYTINRPALPFACLIPKGAFSAEILDQTMKSSRRTTDLSEPGTDLSEKRFGRWSVLRCAGRKYWSSGKKRASRVLWYCRCDCGRERLITRSELVHETTTQCGDCARRREKPLDPKRDLTGKRFGKWLVLRYLRKSVRLANNQITPPRMWLCRCECGTEKAINRGNLVRKLSTQCSDCAHKQSRRPKTKLYRTWNVLKEKKLLTRAWSTFEAFRAAVGDPPDERATLVRIDNKQLHGPGNSLWTWPNSDCQLREARQKNQEQAVRKSKILTKIRHAKTRGRLRDYMVEARKSGFTYTLIGIAAGVSRQGVHQMINRAE
jgi:hypothetical protein